MTLRTALAVMFAMVCLAAPAAAALPAGTLSTTENADGSFNILATVAWDMCPEVCDWKFNLFVVEDPADCPQRALLNRPEGTAYSPGMPGFPDDGPFPSNGTRSVFVPNIYYPRPRYTHACFAAAGLAARADGQYSPSEECPDPRSGPYADDPWEFTTGRCPRLYPIAAVPIPVGLRPMQLPRVPLPPIPVRLTLAEARRALRTRGIRGETRLRRINLEEVRAVVRRASGTTRYRIIKTTGALRVRRQRR